MKDWFSSSNSTLEINKVNEIYPDVILLPGAKGYTIEHLVIRWKKLYYVSRSSVSSSEEREALMTGLILQAFSELMLYWIYILADVVNKQLNLGFFLLSIHTINIKVAFYQEPESGVVLYLRCWLIILYTSLWPYDCKCPFRKPS